MHRCQDCDWSPYGLQSDYHLGLSLQRRPKKLIERNGHCVCDSCRDAEYEYEGDMIDPNEETEDD